jgi:hypothetical protein
MAIAMALLGIFAGWNFYVHEQSIKIISDQGYKPEREQMPDTSLCTSTRMAYHDFESGDAGDSASHLTAKGHGGKQSLILSSRVPFSPGLWIRFKDINPCDSSWIRVSGYVWFSCPVSEAKCSLVATCNHNGINYKYMFIAIEKEAVTPNQWNRISIDYQIPPASDCEDVLQAYFWYRGSGEMLVDDIDVEFYGEFQKNKNH